MVITVRTRTILFTLAGLAFIATELLRTFYRPWVYSRGYYDFGIADSIGSLGGAFVAVFAFSALLASKRLAISAVASGIAIGCVAYEFMQPLLATGIFDISDVFGAFVGGTFAVVITCRVAGSSASMKRPNPES